MTIPIFIGIWILSGVVTVITHILISLYLDNVDITVAELPQLLFLSVVGVIGLVFVLAYLIDKLSLKYKNKVIFKTKTKNNT